MPPSAVSFTNCWFYAARPIPRRPVMQLDTDWVLEVSLHISWISSREAYLLLRQAPGTKSGNEKVFLPSISPVEPLTPLYPKVSTRMDSPDLALPGCRVSCIPVPNKCIYLCIRSALMFPCVLLCRRLFFPEWNPGLRGRIHNTSVPKHPGPAGRQIVCRPPSLMQASKLYAGLSRPQRYTQASRRISTGQPIHL